MIARTNHSSLIERPELGTRKLPAVEKCVPHKRGVLSLAALAEKIVWRLGGCTDEKLILGGIRRE